MRPEELDTLNLILVVLGGTVLGLTSAWGLGIAMDALAETWARRKERDR